MFLRRLRGARVPEGGQAFDRSGQVKSDFIFRRWWFLYSACLCAGRNRHAEKMHARRDDLRALALAAVVLGLKLASPKPPEVNLPPLLRY